MRRRSEDGPGGICDEQQRLCFALALWNGRDPILKERIFGLTGKRGNHGEDAKEYYFYADATPSHSWLRLLYKYPQAEYPYARLIEENRRRGHSEPAFDLLDTGLFAEDRYWDVELCYAKAGPEQVHIRIIAHNRGPDEASLHLIPQLWFRNTWSWDGEQVERPGLQLLPNVSNAAWGVLAEHPTLGRYQLFGARAVDPLITENESNTRRLWGVPGRAAFVKCPQNSRILRHARNAHIICASGV